MSVTCLPKEWWKLLRISKLWFLCNPWVINRTSCSARSILTNSQPHPCIISHSRQNSNSSLSEPQMMNESSVIHFLPSLLPHRSLIISFLGLRFCQTLPYQNLINLRKMMIIISRFLHKTSEFDCHPWFSGRLWCRFYIGLKATPWYWIISHSTVWVGVKVCVYVCVLDR